MKSRRALDVPGLYLLAHAANHEIDDQGFREGQKITDGRDEYVFQLRARQHASDDVREVLEHDNSRRTRIGELVFQLRCRVQRIGVDHGQPGSQRSKQCDRILQRVRHHDGETVAAS